MLRPFGAEDRAWLWERLTPHWRIVAPPAHDDATLATHAAEAEAALGNRISETVLAAAPRLRLLQTPGTGVETLDLAALARRGVIVCNSHSHAVPVAEHGVALLLDLLRKVSIHDRLLRAGTWWRPTGQGDRPYQAVTLSGATIGMVGWGAINRAVAGMLAGFGVRILVSARRFHLGVENVALPELLARSRAVFVAVPLTQATAGMISAGMLAHATPETYVINLGRAELIDRAALLGALESGAIAGAALDTPYGGTDEVAGLADFARLATTVVSPHRAGTVRGPGPHLVDVADNLVAFATGRPLKNIVDVEAGY